MWRNLLLIMWAEKAANSKNSWKYQGMEIYLLKRIPRKNGKFKKSKQEMIWRSLLGITLTYQNKKGLLSAFFWFVTRGICMLHGCIVWESKVTEANHRYWKRQNVKSHSFELTAAVDLCSGQLLQQAQSPSIASYSLLTCPGINSMPMVSVTGFCLLLRYGGMSSLREVSSCSSWQRKGCQTLT